MLTRILSSASFIPNVDRVRREDTYTGFHPSPVEPVARTIFTKTDSYRVRSSTGPASLDLSVGPYRSPARTQLRAVLHAQQKTESIYAGGVRMAEMDRQSRRREIGA